MPEHQCCAVDVDTNFRVHALRHEQDRSGVNGNAWLIFLQRPLQRGATQGHEKQLLAGNDGIAELDLRPPYHQGAGNFDGLYVAPIIAQRLEPEATQLRCDVSGGNPFVPRSATAAVHGVARQKLHMPAHQRFGNRIGARRARRCRVKERQPQKCVPPGVASHASPCPAFCGTRLAVVRGTMAASASAAIRNVPFP